MARKKLSEAPRKLLKDRAVLQRDIELKTVYAKHVYKRSFSHMKSVLFRVSVIFQAVAQDEINKRVDQEISEAFNKLQKEMDSEHARLDALIEDNGIESRTSYPEGLSLTLNIDSQKLGQFVTLLGECDVLVMKNDTLWAHCVISDNELKVRNIECQQKLMKLTRSIVDIYERARSEIYSQPEKIEVDSEEVEAILSSKSKEESKEHIVA